MRYKLYDSSGAIESKDRLHGRQEAVRALELQSSLVNKCQNTSRRPILLQPRHRPSKAVSDSSIRCLPPILNVNKGRMIMNHEWALKKIIDTIR